ncbi:uncharacterized protein LOC110025841 [Phalaenopsis equestris]|uniref:uncharacterized protein LOC110025841 n=1 Tax=Phalaenopsis equestris TaxID=78828 RepID=UPI0009E226A3|nr:uncharacterized protein LOC110025841 [Phalaenopsis equestris]XP_020582169.1 uncharacterized protein LOC110025841 [Phalaenopsis equestris]
MDGEAGTADDQGSGWFEVRKKHRIGSKLSIQKVSGGSSNKGHSWNYLPSRNAKIVKFPTVQQAECSKVRTGLNPDSIVSVNTSGLSSPAAVETLVCLDEVVGGQHIDHSLKFTDSTVALNATTAVLLHKNLDEIPKIKWGDIEDVSFTVSVSGDSGKTMDDAENAHFASCDEQKQQDLALAAKTVVLASSTIDVAEENAKSENFEHVSDLILSFDAPEKFFSGTWREVSEDSSEYKNIIETELKENLKEIHDVTDEQNEAPNDLISEDLVVGSPSLASLVGGVIEMTAEESPDKSVGRNVSFSEESVINEIAVAKTSSHDLPESISDGVKVSFDASTANEDVLIDEPDQGEDEHSEGKERFRERLWCFLFENLIRAVDELYLLCELECDIEQMNEAVLVLEEAISDFRELKCRVDHFETKRFASQSSKDVTGASLKTDHRRPHALSWEVRRMTTSPHRAEILSSSLEAFRKIQSERASKHIAHDGKDPIFPPSTIHTGSENSPGAYDKHLDDGRQTTGSEGRRRVDAIHGSSIIDKTHLVVAFHSRSCSARASLLTSEKLLVSSSGKGKKEPLEPISEFEKLASRKDRLLADNGIEKQSNVSDMIKRNNSQCIKEKEKDKRNTAPWKTMDAWKEKRNWEDILKSPLRSSSRVSCSPGLGRKNVERARVLHDKLMSPEKKKKSALDTRREAEERHARAMRIRGQLENERLQRLQRASEKLNRVNEWQAVRSLKLREGLNARQQRGETRHEAYLAQVVRRAGDESSKVNEVRFITSLNEENKKLILRQKLHNSELRRAEKMQTIRVKQKEDMAREEAAMERRKLLEAEKMQRLAETQRKKEEAQLRREEERKASSAAREAKAVEQLRRKEIRAKARQEEAELLAQKLAERLSESELRRKFYLEQIREKASTDFRDQSSPLVRRSLNREGPSRHLPTNGEDNQTSCVPVIGNSEPGVPYPTQQQSLKRRIKRIRQRLMALKHEFIEPLFVAENLGLGCRTLLGTARVKIGRWLKELQRLCQARKEGAASIGLIVCDMLKFLEGKDIELHASRQAGLLDFISSALPASHTSKPESCQVTVYFLRLLRVLLSVPANRAYFLALNLLPPIIPMLSASLDNYIKVAASSNHGTNNSANKMPTDNMDTVTEVLDSFLFTVTTIMGYTTNDERELQMQVDLLELIVSYQAIHRLRDLFALYDRPQVEGSPFPSSIILSLNLLSVLTSRPGSISSINWDAGISKSAIEKENEFSEIVDYNDVVDKFVMSDASGDGKSSQLATLPQPSETIPATESTQMVMKRVLSDIPETQSRKETSDFSLESNREEVTSVADELYIGSQKCNSEEIAKSPLDQEDQKITKDSQACRKRNDEVPCNYERNKEATSKQPLAFFLSAMAETGLVSLTSLLTAVLLHANSRLSSDMASYVLPSNFEEVAIGVLRVLNNLACLDIFLLQKMLARSDLRMEFFHLMSFLLSHCTSRWKSANDKVGFLLLESLLLLGYFSLFHSGNQAVLRWGKPPTILHKICDLPFVFFSDPELTPILAGTFVAACYGCEQNKGVIQQELSIEMLLNLLRSCRHSLLTSHFDSSPPDSNTTNSSSDSISSAPDAKKIHGDSSSRPNRKGGQTLSSKGVTAGTRAMKCRVQRDNKKAKTCDEWAFMHNLPTSDASSAFMLHRRFPTCFLDKAEEFFAAGNLDLPA